MGAKTDKRPSKNANVCTVSLEVLTNLHVFFNGSLWDVYLILWHLANVVHVEFVAHVEIVAHVEFVAHVESWIFLFNIHRKSYRQDKYNQLRHLKRLIHCTWTKYEGWNFNFGNTPLDWIQELLEWRANAAGRMGPSPTYIMGAVHHEMGIRSSQLIVSRCRDLV